MRYAFHLTIREGLEDEYDRRHSAVWDDMKRMLKGAGISNYSIFRDGTDVILRIAHEETYVQTPTFLRRSKADPS